MTPNAPAETVEQTQAWEAAFAGSTKELEIIAADARAFAKTVPADTDDRW